MQQPTVVPPTEIIPLSQNLVALLSAFLGSALTIVAASGGGLLKERRKRKAIAIALEIEARHNSKAMNLRLDPENPFVVVRSVLGVFDENVELFDPTTIFLVGEYRSALLGLEAISASYASAMKSTGQGKSEKIDQKFREVIKVTDELIETVSAHLKNLPWWGMKLRFGVHKLLRLSPPRTPGINVAAAKKP